MTTVSFTGKLHVGDIMQSTGCNFMQNISGERGVGEGGAFGRQYKNRNKGPTQ